MVMPLKVGIVDVGVKLDLHNPWNLFQHENKGKGWSPQKMAAMYKVWKTNPKRKNALSLKF